MMTDLENSTVQSVLYSADGWKQKKLVEASLSDYIHASMQTQGWGRERIFISEFFGGQEYIGIEAHVGTYSHNLAQFVHKEFFENVSKFKKIHESNPDSSYDNTPMAAAFEEIEIDHNKTIRGYSDAAIGYTSEDGDKILVIISRQDANDIWYRVMCKESRGNLLKDWFNYSTKHNLYKNKKINAGCKFLDLSSNTWDDVILPNRIVELLQDVVQGAISREEIYKKNKLSLKRGVLLCGKPGCGKTSAIKVIAKEVPVTVIYAQPSHLLYPKDVRHVCSMAKDLAPCILIIEDIDWIAEDRDTGDAGRVIELMNQLDGLEEFSNVITIATTNDVEKIEKAIKNRPGRFDRVVNIDIPDEDCRHRMIRLFTKHWNFSNDIDIEKIVSFSDGLSGAHMHDLCVTAAVKAIDNGSLDENQIVILQKEHFELAIKEVKDKDFSSYMKMKSTAKPSGIGFNAARLDELDDDF